MSRCLWQRAKQLTCCQKDSLSRWKRRQAVMWWGCPQVKLAQPGQTASLWLPVSVCEIVCGFCCVCRCLCPALDQLFVYAAGLRREQGFAGSCYCIPAPPKIWSPSSFCARSLILCLHLHGLVFLNPGFQCHFNLSLRLSQIYSCLIKAGCSLTLILALVSAPLGLLNCPRSSGREKAQRDRRRRGAQTMLELIKLTRNEFPVSKHTL